MKRIATTAVLSAAGLIAGANMVAKAAEVNPWFGFTVVWVLAAAVFVTAWAVAR